MSEPSVPKSQVTNKEEIAWDFAGTRRHHLRLGLQMTPAERLRWLEETVEGCASCPFRRFSAWRRRLRGAFLARSSTLHDRAMVKSTARCTAIRSVGGRREAVAAIQIAFRASWFRRCAP
jgi:hypothetical protein